MDLFVISVLYEDTSTPPADQTGRFQLSSVKCESHFFQVCNLVLTISSRYALQDMDKFSLKDSGRGDSEAGDSDCDMGRESPVDRLLLGEGFSDLIHLEMHHRLHPGELMPLSQSGCTLQCCCLFIILFFCTFLSMTYQIGSTQLSHIPNTLSSCTPRPPSTLAPRPRIRDDTFQKTHTILTPHLSRNESDQILKTPK